MKKVVVVYLDDKVFQMEEEAYFYLHGALENQWQKKDLEARVAGILEEKTRENKAITLPEVVEALYRLGIKSPDGCFAGNPVKKLYRQPSDKVIAGVCGGLGRYFGIDPVLVRVLFLLAFFLGSLGFWVYVALWIVIPRSPAP
ncbi:MAG: PspC domain-containing protein [Odoribacteraceae bacterium]|jgi:phage shock protein C|nr:PspC domain-containing protein [Odoribacteraceae bacterium]